MGETINRIEIYESQDGQARFEVKFDQNDSLDWLDHFTKDLELLDDYGLPYLAYHQMASVLYSSRFRPKPIKELVDSVLYQQKKGFFRTPISSTWLRSYERKRLDQVCMIQR